jgi:hypothetical protein
MPITKSPIDSIFRKPTTGIYIPLLNLNAVNPVKPIAAAIRRIFTPLLGSGSQHYLVNTPPVFNAGFKVEFLLAGTFKADRRVFGITDTAGNIFTVITRPDGGVGVFSRGAGSNKFVATSGVDVLDGKLNKINLIYDDAANTLKVSNNGTLVLNETLNSNQVPDLTNIDIMKVGAGENNNFVTFTGFLADFKLYNDDVLVIDAPLDKQYTAIQPTVINKAATLGSEEIPNVVFANATGWDSPRNDSVITVSNGNLRSTADSSSTFGSAAAMTSLVVGNTYLVESLINSSNASANARLRVSEDQTLNSVTASRDDASGINVSLTFVATATTMHIGTIVTGHSSGDFVDIERISVKDIPNATPYLTAVNLNNAGSEFIASDDYGWLGQNEVGSTDRIGSDWTNNGDGSFTIDTPDGNINNCNLRFSKLSTGSRYLVELTATTPVGSDKVRLRDCTPNVDYDTAGNFADIVIPFNNNTPSFNRVAGQSFVQTISNISNRQVLEIAEVSQ